MGVDDNSSNTPGKQKLKIPGTRFKTQEGEKSSLSAPTNIEQIGGRSLRQRQRTSVGNTGGSGTNTADTANSE